MNEAPNPVSAPDLFARKLLSRFLFIVLLTSLVQTTTSGKELVKPGGLKNRVSLYPILFIPDEVSVSEKSLLKAKKSLKKHLEIARNFYFSLLKTDTFLIGNGVIPVFRGSLKNHLYLRAKRGNEEDSAHLITRELFDHRGDNRINSHHIYLVIYIRPDKSPYEGEGHLFGGGRTFNGQPGSGGGYIELEYSSLEKDTPYPFQSTLIHELGHSFGLVHADSYGYDMNGNNSIMSYNPAHHSSGLRQSLTPGNLNPEDYYTLSLNYRVFPNFRFIKNIHNTKGIKIRQIYLNPMSDFIGKIPHQLAVGYELFYNKNRVNGPDAAFYTFDQAQKNCSWNTDNKPSICVDCSYNGKIFKSCHD